MEYPETRENNTSISSLALNSIEKTLMEEVENLRHVQGVSPADIAPSVTQPIDIIDPEVNEWIKKGASYDQQLKEILNEAQQIIYKKVEQHTEATVKDLSAFFASPQCNQSKEDFNINIFKILSPLIEGSNLPLKALSKKCEDYLKPLCNSPLSYENIESAITEGAKRIAYGIIKKNANIYEDTDSTCLWAWEMINTSFVPAYSALDKSKKLSIQQKIKALSALTKKISTIKTKDDIPTIVKAQENYLNLIRKETVIAQKEREKAEKQKQKENENKEKQAKKELELKEKQAKRDQENKMKQIKKDQELKDKQLKKEQDKIAKQEAKKTIKKPKDDPNTASIEKLKDLHKEEIKEMKQLSSPDAKRLKISDQEVDNTQTSLFKFISPQMQSNKKQDPIQLENKDKFNANNFEKLLFANIQVSLALSTFNKKPVNHHSKIKYINFFDQRIFVGCLKRDTTQILATNPFSKDPNINYENDTEDEYAELTAENVDSADDEEDNEDDELSEESKGFVVPDGYLSSDEKSDVAPDNISPSCALEKPIVSNEEFLTASKECEVKLSKFYIVSLRGKFPIRIVKKQEKKEQQKAPSIALLSEHIPDLVKLLHGSYYNKDKIINDFKAQFESIPKKTIHKKISEITFKKRWNMPWIVTMDTFASIEMPKEIQDAIFEKNKEATIEFFNQQKLSKLKTKEEGQKMSESIEKFVSSQQILQCTPTFGEATPTPSKQ